MSDDLLTRIGNYRADYAAELHFPVSSSLPLGMSVWDEETRSRLIDDEVEMSTIGKTLTVRMLRHLSRDFSNERGPVRKALERLDAWCDRRHDHEGFCAQAVNFLVKHAHGSGEHGIEKAWDPELRYNWYARMVRRVALDGNLPYEDTVELVEHALNQIDQWMAEWAKHAA